MSCADVWLPWLSSFPSAALTVAACSLSSGRLCLRPLSCSFKPRLRQNHVIWHAQLLWGAVQLRYMLGGDRDRSLFAGMGKNPPTHIQNRAASCPSPPAPCNMVGPLQPACVSAAADERPGNNKSELCGCNSLAVQDHNFTQRHLWKA
jgi:hypothetical protein